MLLLGANNEMLRGVHASGVRSKGAKDAALTGSCDPFGKYCWEREYCIDRSELTRCPDIM